MKKLIFILALLAMITATSCETVGEGPCIKTEVSDVV